MLKERGKAAELEVDAKIRKGLDGAETASEDTASLVRYPVDEAALKAALTAGCGRMLCVCHVVSYRRR